MNIKESKYDHIGNFNQGVAVVVKDGLYGVILMGGMRLLPLAMTIFLHLRMVTLKLFVKVNVRC